MSTNNNDKHIYNFTDIQRYLDGKMSAGEMNAMERAAMDDPFLADALEGYNSKTDMDKTDTAADLVDLRARLNKRTENQEKKIIPFYNKQWWKVAAVLLLLVGSGTIIYYLAISPATDKTVVAKNSSGEQKAIAPDSSPVIVSRNVDSTVVALNDPKDRRADAMPAMRQPLKRAAEPGNSIQPASPIVSMAPKEKKSDKILEQTDSASDLASSAESDRRVNMVNKEVMTSRKAEANYKTKPVNDKADETKIELQEAVPAFGLDSFNHYIEINKKILLSNDQHGEVLVSFSVSKNGKLSKFKIEKSLSKLMDEEAIRLIKEGPPWKVLNNKRTKAFITIYF